MCVEIEFRRRSFVLVIYAIGFLERRVCDYECVTGRKISDERTTPPLKFIFVLIFYPREIFF